MVCNNNLKICKRKLRKSRRKAWRFKKKLKEYGLPAPLPVAPSGWKLKIKICREYLNSLKQYNALAQELLKSLESSCCNLSRQQDIEKLKKCYECAQSLKTLWDNCEEGPCKNKELPGRDALNFFGGAGSYLPLNFTPKSTDLCYAIRNKNDPNINLCTLFALPDDITDKFNLKFGGIEIGEKRGNYWGLVPGETPPQYLVFFTHGGGWVAGSGASGLINLATDYSYILKDRNDIAYFSIDYMTSPGGYGPDGKFINGRYEAVNMINKECYEKISLKYFPNGVMKSIIMGDSAGGGCAASLALCLQNDTSNTEHIAQFLCSPCLAGDPDQWKELDSWRNKTYEVDGGLSNESMAFYWGTHSEYSQTYKVPDSVYYSPYNTVTGNDVQKGKINNAKGPMYMIAARKDILFDENVGYYNNFIDKNSMQIEELSELQQPDLSHDPFNQYGSQFIEWAGKWFIN